MSALTVDHASTHGDCWEDLVQLWERTEGPEGCKVEIIEGIVTVSPSPANSHNQIAGMLHRSLLRAIPEDWGIYQTLGVAVPVRNGLFIPDLVVMPEAALKAPGHYVSALEAELVVEITSPSNARHDRISKPAAYAQAGVPLYLLVDPWLRGGPTVTLYGDPEGEVYRVVQTGKFGEEIHLPEPFDLTLDTSGFPTG